MGRFFEKLRKSKAGLDFKQSLYKATPISGRKKNRKSVRYFPIRTGQEISRKSVRIPENSQEMAGIRPLWRSVANNPQGGYRGAMATSVI